MVRHSPLLASHAEFRRYTRLRGTSVLATRLYLDTPVTLPYSANACWGFDNGVGMTCFDIRALHAPALEHEPGGVVEVDYYHADPLLAMDDDQIVAKARADLGRMYGAQMGAASVVDAAVVRLPNAVNWYSPGSYKNMPDAVSQAIPNAYFVGDLVRTRHGSWSQEKAFVTGVEAANLIRGRPRDEGVLPLAADEAHVAAGRRGVRALRSFLGRRAPSIAGFLW